MRRLVLLSVIAAAVALARGSGLAGACDCAVPTPPEILERADLVVTGTVDAGPTEVEPPRLDGSYSSADLLRYEVAVEAVHHGEAGPAIEVVSERDGASCGIDLPPGRYLVVASRDDEGRLHSGLCSGTRPLEAGEEPAGFGPGQAPDRAAPATTAPRPVGGPGGDVVEDDLGPLATAVRWAAVGAVVVALGAGAVLVARRRRPPAT